MKDLSTEYLGKLYNCIFGNYTTIAELNKDIKKFIIPYPQVIKVDVNDIENEKNSYVIPLWNYVKSMQILHLNSFSSYDRDEVHKINWVPYMEYINFKMSVKLCSDAQDNFVNAYLYYTILCKDLMPNEAIMSFDDFCGLFKYLNNNGETIVKRCLINCDFYEEYAKNSIGELFKNSDIVDYVRYTIEPVLAEFDGKINCIKYKTIIDSIRYSLLETAKYMVSLFDYLIFLKSGKTYTTEHYPIIRKNIWCSFTFFVDYAMKNISYKKIPYKTIHIGKHYIIFNDCQYSKLSCSCTNDIKLCEHKKFFYNHIDKIFSEMREIEPVISCTKNECFCICPRYSENIHLSKDIAKQHKDSLILCIENLLVIKKDKDNFC